MSYQLNIQQNGSSSIRQPAASFNLALPAGGDVLVNLFTLDKADEETFLKAWQDDAVFMKRQPGFISTQLHRAIGESPTYLNYAVWESTADCRSPRA
jgi:precorrin-2 methylase